MRVERGRYPDLRSVRASWLCRGRHRRLTIHHLFLGILIRRRAKAKSALHLSRRVPCMCQTSFLTASMRKRRFGQSRASVVILGCRGTERLRHAASSGMVEEAERLAPSSQRKRHATRRAKCSASIIESASLEQSWLARIEANLPRGRCELR